MTPLLSMPRAIVCVRIMPVTSREGLSSIRRLIGGSQGTYPARGRAVNQVRSRPACPQATYAASVLESEIMGCLIEIQFTGTL
jgi:hypothetical protein